MGPLLVLAALSALPAQACSCAYGPHERPCQAMMNVEIAFIGRVVALDYQDEHLRARIHVDESLRGFTGREAEVYTRASSCGVNLKLGKAYFIDAHREESGRLYTGACSRTTTLNKAREDIEALRMLMGRDGPVQIFGYATANPVNLVLRYRADPPTEGVRLKLRSGERQWETTTNDKGEYSFTGIPAGDFQLSAQLTNVPEQHKHRKFQLNPGECRGEYFLTISFGSVSGHLLDSTGLPVQGQSLKITGVPPTPDPKIIFTPLTNKDGGFRFDNLPMGSYSLSLNGHQPPNSRDWYGNRSPHFQQAHPFTLKDGNSIENIEFRLLPMPLRKTITGTVILPDGSPAKALVSLLDPNYPSDTAQVDTVRTSESGLFELQLQEGRRYLLFAQTELGNRILHSGFLDLTSTTPSPLRVLLPNDDPSNQCAACRHFRIWESPLWQKNP